MSGGWRKINTCDVARIRRVVAVFEVIENRKVPFGKFKIKVLEDPEGTFIAFPNLAYAGDDDGPDWLSGFGNTVEEALEDCLHVFMDSIPEKSNREEKHFEWAAPEDF